MEFVPSSPAFGPKVLGCTASSLLFLSGQIGCDIEHNRFFLHDDAPVLDIVSRDLHFPPWWWESFIFKKTFPPWERGWWDNFSHHGPEAGGIVFLLSHHGGGTVDMGSAQGSRWGFILLATTFFIDIF